MRPRVPFVNPVLVIALFVCLAAHSQTPAAPSATQAAPAPAKFEYAVATIKPDNSHRGFWKNTPDGFITSSTPVMSLMMSAYKLAQPQQIIGLPAWASNEPLQVTAKMDDDTVTALAKLPLKGQWDERQKMLQALLAERFGLKVHHETRQMPVYVMTVVRRGKLKPSDTDKGGHADFTNAKITAHAMTIDNLVLNLGNTVGRMVINQTGLQGTYDFTLEWAPEGSDSSDPRPSIFTALEEQLGLKLKNSQSVVDTVVVDAISRPSEN